MKLISFLMPKMFSLQYLYFTLYTEIQDHRVMSATECPSGIQVYIELYKKL